MRSLINAYRLGVIHILLKRKVEKYLHKTIYKNETFKHNRWSWRERLVVWSSKNLYKANITIILLAFTIFILLSTYYDSIKQLFPVSLKELLSIAELPGAIFIAQITILGVIFPLVITFIGVLLQGKSSNEAMWLIYKNNSGFMVVGFSSLALSAIFILFKLSEPWLTYQYSVSASISITIWFLTNLWLTGWFLHKTIKFLSLKERMEMVSKYAINEVVAENIRKNLSEHYYSDVHRTESNSDLNREIKVHDSTSLNIKQIIGALYDQVEGALQDNSLRLFKTATDNLVQFQKEIEASMFFINDDGKHDSLTLVTEAGIFGRDFLEAFIVESRTVAIEVTNRIQYDSSYFEVWCKLYTRIYANKNQNIRVAKVTEKYITGHYYLWGTLMSFMHGVNETNSIVRENADRALKQFIGSWEHWQHYVGENANLDGAFCLDNTMYHLERTSRMLIEATKYDNNDAIEWATDMLVLWVKLFSDSNLRDENYIPNSDLITLTILDNCENQPLLHESTVDKEHIKPIVTSIALKNYWTDIRYLTAAYLMWSNQYHENRVYIKCINALLRCKQLDPNGPEPLRHKESLTVQKVLRVYLRQSDWWGTTYVYKDRTYTGFIEGHLKYISSFKEPQRIPYRGYSSFDPDWHKFFSVFCRIIGSGLITEREEKFKLDSDLMTFLKSDIIRLEDLERVTTNLKNLTEKGESEPIIDPVCNLFNIDTIEYNLRERLFIESINQIIDDLEKHGKLRIINAPIDNKRLDKLSVKSSEEIFKPSSMPIQISLFKNIEFIDNFNLKLYKKFSNYFDKRSFVKDSDINHSEDKKIIKFVVEQVIITCFKQFNEKLSFRTNNFKDNSSLIKRATEDIASMQAAGLTPIMFIGQFNLWHQLKEIKVQRSADSNDFYSGRSLADIEVYDFPYGMPGYNILIAKETFQTIKIKRFDDERYVDLTFITEPSEQLTGKLVLSFGIECEFSDEKCFKYQIEPNE